MKNIIWLKIEGDESNEAFVGRCRQAVRAFRLARNGAPRPFIVNARQLSGCYHGHPHKRETVIGLAGHQPAIATAAPFSERGAHYEPTAEAVALVGVVL